MVSFDLLILHVRTIL